MADEPGENRWQAYQPGGSTPSSERDDDPPAPAVPARASTLTTPPTRPGGRSMLSLAVVFVVAVVLGIVVLVNLGDDDASEATDDTSVGERREPAADAEQVDVLTADGFADLLAAVEAETGGTEVFDATMYRGYAVLQLPVDATSRRYSTYYWDGELSDNDSRGTAGSGRVDLARVDVDTMVRLVGRVSRLVEQPTSRYVIVRGPFSEDRAEDDGVRLSVYASNEYSESAYIAADLRGTVIRRYVSTEE